MSKLKPCLMHIIRTLPGDIRTRRNCCQVVFMIAVYEGQIWHETGDRDPGEDEEQKSITKQKRKRKKKRKRTKEISSS